MPRPRVWSLLLLGLALAAFVSPATADEPTTRIVLIGKDPDHPPKSHEYMFECALLAKCLGQTPGIETVVSNGWPTDPAVLESADALVLYTAVGGDLLHDPARKEQVDALLKRGVGVVALHWGTGASPGERGEAFLKTMGGWFHQSFSEIPVCESAIRPADPEHPIARGWTVTPMRDEYYIKLKFLPEAHPVVVANVNGLDYPVGWTHERPDGGRSFGYVCGHFHDCFRLEPFRRSVVNGILWAARVDVPTSGAPVEVAEADLELPPDPRVTDEAPGACACHD